MPYPKSWKRKDRSISFLNYVIVYIRREIFGMYKFRKLNNLLKDANFITETKIESSMMLTT
jgi:hypothetical protein